MRMSFTQVLAITIVIAMLLLTLLEGIIKFMSTELFLAILIHGWGVILLILLHKIIFIVKNNANNKD